MTSSGTGLAALSCCSTAAVRLAMRGGVQAGGSPKRGIGRSPSTFVATGTRIGILRAATTTTPTSRILRSSWFALGLDRPALVGASLGGAVSMVAVAEDKVEASPW